MGHPLIQDFNIDLVHQALDALINQRFPKIVVTTGFEDRFKSAAACILRAQERLAGALDLQFIEQRRQLTQKQRLAQAEDLYKSGVLTDKRGARVAGLRVVGAKPKPTQWRRKLQRLRTNPNRLMKIIADRDLREVIRLGAFRSGILDQCDPRWLHHLNGNPADLQLVIQAALDDPFLCEDTGRPNEQHISAFVAEVINACHDLTNYTLSHKVRRKGDKRSEIASNDNDIGEIISPDIILIQDLLAPLGDLRSADGVSHLIRNARTAK